MVSEGIANPLRKGCACFRETVVSAEGVVYQRQAMCLPKTTSVVIRPAFFCGTCLLAIVSVLIRELRRILREALLDGRTACRCFALILVPIRAFGTGELFFIGMATIHQLCSSRTRSNRKYRTADSESCGHQFSISFFSLEQSCSERLGGSYCRIFSRVLFF